MNALTQIDVYSPPTINNTSLDAPTYELAKGPPSTVKPRKNPALLKMTVPPFKQHYASKVSDVSDSLSLEYRQSTLGQPSMMEPRR